MMPIPSQSYRPITKLCLRTGKINRIQGNEGHASWRVDMRHPIRTVLVRQNMPGKSLRPYIAALTRKNRPHV